MKTRILQLSKSACLTAFITAAATSAWADQPAPAGEHLKHSTGLILCVDPQNRTINVKGFMSNKKLNAGDNCAFVLANNGAGTLNDMRVGQKVTVSYQNASGVLIASRIEQKPMTYEGTVKAINPQSRRLTLHLRASDKTLAIADDCKIMLRDNREGTLSDILPGHHVTVVYEKPQDMVTAFQIGQTSASVSGSLCAVDGTDRTIKIQTLMGATTYHLGDGCVILANGKQEGRLNDLRLGEKVTLSYDPVNGVNVVSRIAQSETPPPLSAQAGK